MIVHVTCKKRRRSNQSKNEAARMLTIFAFFIQILTLKRQLTLQSVVRPGRISNKFEYCVCPASLQEKKQCKLTYTNFTIISLCGKFIKAQWQPHLQSEGGSGRILNSFEIFIVDLVIYRNEEDPIENEGA